MTAALSKGLDGFMATTPVLEICFLAERTPKKEGRPGELCHERVTRRFIWSAALLPPRWFRFFGFGVGCTEKKEPKRR
jgi:hypothetical protein